jgi:hypothetical protein
VIHYHGTPITPLSVKHYALTGRHAFISFEAPRDVEFAAEVCQSFALDNGAFSVWKRGHEPDWSAYYAWCAQWLDYPTTWAVIPDVIVGDEADNNLLCRAWPHGRERGAPVWHMHERPRRLLELLEGHPRVCIGSSGEYAEVMADGWQRRMDAAWREIDKRFKRTPTVHMLRGLQLIRERWPFASVDSTDIARNHNRDGNTAAKMRARWDAGQCPPRFIDPGEQLELAA